MPRLIASIANIATLVILPILCLRCYLGFPIFLFFRAIRSEMALFSTNKTCELFRFLMIIRSFILVIFIWTLSGEMAWLSTQIANNPSIKSIVAIHIFSPIC